MQFLFLTKTLWCEQPRLRHQLARLLANAGHTVHFVEKPCFPYELPRASVSGHQNIHLYQKRQLVHHKLRVNRLIQSLNAVYESREISGLISGLEVRKFDVVVNFNYDYYFLRTLFPDSSIYTIINDDFWSRAFFGYQAPLKGMLARTCAISDEVLTVSTPLYSQLEQFCRPKLFYPWADVPYFFTESKVRRDTLLFWGHLTSRLDYSFVSRLLEQIENEGLDYRILFVGPVGQGGHEFEKVKAHPSVQYLSSTALDDLPLERVLAGFIPYKENVAEIDAITLPNKALQLLARGLPLTITGMPNFIEAPFVFKFNQKNTSNLKMLEFLERSFIDLQGSIREFVQKNSGQARLNELYNLFDSEIVSESVG